MNALENLIDYFQKEQGWNNETVLGILKNFLWDRRDKWQYKSMIIFQGTFESLPLREEENFTKGLK